MNIYYYYQILNNNNGKFYVGITTQPEERKKSHFRNLLQNKHTNYKLQEDFNKYGPDFFSFEILEKKKNFSKEEAYDYERKIIEKKEAIIKGYNILPGGTVNPVYSLEVLEKITKTHQAKYPDILQYKLENNKFTLVKRWKGLRDATRTGKHDFRALQKSVVNTNAHHDFYWVKNGEQEKWLKTFLNRFTFCVARINEKTQVIEDAALTPTEIAKKYNTTYSKVINSIYRGDRCERKYKFIRISAEEFAKINNLTL